MERETRRSPQQTHLYFDRRMLQASKIAQQKRPSCLSLKAFWEGNRIKSQCYECPLESTSTEETLWELEMEEQNLATKVRTGEEEKGKVCTRIWLGSCVIISCPSIRCLRMKKIIVIEANGQGVILNQRIQRLSKG